MKTGHLFAGAGGGIYADLILGHESIFAVEQDRYAAAALRSRIEDGWFNGMQLHYGDVRMFDSSKYKGLVDSLHAGFPCQDISVAGNGKGITGERSGLWSEVVRCAGELEPSELFLENSPEITTRGLGTVLGDLAQMGFDARWIVLPASAVGAPHIRARWWCIARHSDRYGLRELQQKRGFKKQRGWSSDICSEIPDPNSLRGGPEQIPGKKREDSSELGNDGKNQYVADSSCICLQRIVGKGTNSEVWKKQEKRPPGSCCDGLGWWSVESSVGRVVNGLANRGNRIKCLGNGQVPLQAAAAYLILDSMF